MQIEPTERELDLEPKCPSKQSGQNEISQDVLSVFIE